LLFCGICLKHYAYHNMSRRSQLTTKFTFALMAQLTENFIFIYLGLSLFTESGLEYKPLFILVTLIGICAARWCAVFPLSALINWVIRYRARRRGIDSQAEEIPRNWQMMLFWAGLRGAVGVALAAGLTGPNGLALRATVLITVLLTVIIFGGTTAPMLEILNIRTGVVEDIDSDDEFDIEPIPHSANGRKNGSIYGHNAKNSSNGIDLNNVRNKRRGHTASYSSGNQSPHGAPTHHGDGERGSSRPRRGGSNTGEAQSVAEEGLLSSHSNNEDYFGDEYDHDDLDLPPAARRNSQRALGSDGSGSNSGSAGAAASQGSSTTLTARGAISQILNATSEDAGNLFTQLDENFLKPHLLLDPSSGRGGGSGGV
jgi:sodium/hydrogen exchanger-like protein 6/7